MRKLATPVKRETIGLIDQHRPATITLYPGEAGVRLQGQRREWRTSIQSIYYLAMKQELRAERQRREGLARQK